MLPLVEALVRYHVQDHLDQAEHARLIARLRSHRRARRRAANQVRIRATTAEGGSVQLHQTHEEETGFSEARVSTVEGIGSA
jgi:hypothetical protein